MFGDLPEYSFVINLKMSFHCSQKTLYDFSLLKFIESCFMVQHMVCPGECSTSVSNKCCEEEKKVQDITYKKIIITGNRVSGKK